MKNIVYFCPRMNTPIGGIKVIHKHSELINSIGGKSEIYYCKPYEDDVVDWFPHNVKIREASDVDPDKDIVVFAESIIFDYWKDVSEAGVEYGIFVQNGYLVNSNISHEDAKKCYAGAKFIICISEDAVRCIFNFFPEQAKKVVRAIYSVDSNLFRSAEKENIITFMPRKMIKHSDLLVPMVEDRLPADWRILKIDKMSEHQVAENLSKSRIFMAFSGMEGLPVPPVEAALAGNFVIGYTGQGGREYWNPPIFEPIESGDIVGFMNAVLKKIDDISRYDLAIGDNNLRMLREYFSKESEIRSLKSMLEVIYA
jgi:hypothetical protein